MIGDGEPLDARGLLGSLEARVMEDLWAHPPSVVGDVVGRLNHGKRRQLAYNTVMTVMAKLADKGYLLRHRTGRAFVYQPVQSRSDFVRSRAAEAARDLVDDFDELAVAGFIDSIRDRPAMLRELERLMSSDGLDDEPPAA